MNHMKQIDNTATRNRISVIVPIFKVEEYLPQCIESIINQTYKELEIILVNDGSPDKCAQICDYYATVDSRIKVIHKTNGGLVSARKAGLKISTGEYIACVDGDDWIEPDMYTELITAAKSSKADVVVGGHKEELCDEIVEIAYNKIPAGTYTEDRLSREVFPKMLYTGEFSNFGIYSYLWNKLFRRSILFENQMAVDDRIFMAEDAACTYSTLLDAKSICIINTASYIYRQRINSMVKTRDKAILDIEKFNLVYKHLHENFTKHPLSDVLTKQLKFFMISLLTVRTDIQLINKNSLDYAYPFGKIQQGSKVVIFGAGTFGQQLYHRFVDSRILNVVAWVDELYKHYKNAGLSVSSPDILQKLKYDKVLIAFINEEVADKLIERLISSGIPKEKIAKPSNFTNQDLDLVLSNLGIKTA